MAEKEKKKNGKAKARPPVVVVLGHIDHGKSSILEAVKDLKITERESGGITQHIGAYEIEHAGKKMTFIDTPGHEAFSQMRSRGARAADIAVLVVDGAEGVKSQTKEAISHAKEAGIPIVVAVNKMDKPQADAARVKNELSKNGVLVEDLGGKVPCVEVSAATKQGIVQLLEIISLVAEMEELKADVSAPARGVVVESYLDGKRGPTATLILEDGSLAKGDVVGTPSAFGKVRILEDFQGRPVEKALPSMPAVAVGFGKVPLVGEKFRKYPDMESAAAAAERARPPAEKKEGVEEEAGGKNALNIVLKTDVLGSAEAAEEILAGIPQDKVSLRILKSGPGAISESDVKLAAASGAVIVGFRTKPSGRAAALAEREKVKIMTFEVIYSLVEGVRGVMARLVEPKVVRKETGKLKVLIIFKEEKGRCIVGCRVLSGEARKGFLIDVLRDERPAGKGKLAGLQVRKKEVEKAAKGKECGVLFKGDAEVKEGDILILYTEEKKKEKL